jgi:multiple sugar transport system permease protein
MFDSAKHKKRETRATIFFLSPSVLLMLLFFIGPIIISMVFAFTNMTLIGAESNHIQFVGFKNFIMMFNDPGFRTSIWKTVVFLFFSAIVGQQVLGFMLAYLMREKKRGARRFVGICVLAGWVTPEIVCAFIWLSFLDYTGTLNKILGSIGIPAVSWLFAFPMVSVIIANIWKGTAFSMMIFESSLGSISKDVEEAAVIDGAGPLKKLWHVILPMLKNTIVTNMILVTLMTINAFGLVFAMTGGGPGMSTQILSIFMYNQAFVSYQLGYGMAIALVMLAFGIIMSLIYVKMLKSEI